MGNVDTPIRMYQSSLLYVKARCVCVFCLSQNIFGGHLTVSTCIDQSATTNMSVLAVGRHHTSGEQYHVGHNTLPTIPEVDFPRFKLLYNKRMSL